MIEEEALKSAKQTLRKAQELMGKVREQNKKWHGSGAFEEDIISAWKLLMEMEQDLSDVVVTLSQGFFRDTRNQDLKMEFDLAYNKACSLMSHLYDDIGRVHNALPKGQSQSGDIKAIEIHLKQLVSNSLKSRDYLLEAV